MTEGGKDGNGGSTRDGGRKARLAEELRANLQRRKAQARSRRAGDADRRPEGIAASRDSADHEKGHKKD